MTAVEKITCLKKALHYGGDTHTWEDVILGLREGKFQIFDSDDGCIITEIIQSPRKRYQSLWLAGGRLPGIMDLVPEIARHAIENECAKLVVTGRPGWRRVLPLYGWKETGAVFEKELTDAL